MYLHIGNDQMVPLEDVVMILDYRKIIKSADSKKFLQRILAASSRETGQEAFKSMVVTDQKVFYSPISSTTLLKRSSPLGL